APEDRRGGGVHGGLGYEPQPGEDDAQDLARRDRHRADRRRQERRERQEQEEAPDPDPRSPRPAPRRKRQGVHPLRGRDPHSPFFASRSSRASWLTASPMRGPMPRRRVSSRTTIFRALPAGVRARPGTLQTLSGPPSEARVRSVTRRTSGLAATSASVLMGR